LHRVLKALGQKIHAGVSSNKHLAAWYLATLGQVCRALPDGEWKQFVWNSIESVEWPELRFKPVNTRFADGVLKANLVPHLREFDFQVQIYRQLGYESETFRWLATRSYRAVVDIGANVGVFSIYFAKRFPDAMVYAFEPSRAVFFRLLTNVDLNPCPNLSVFNCAIFSQSGFLDFHEPDGHLPNGSLDASFASLFSRQIVSTPVPVLAASAMEPFFDRSPILVKIDAEGAEPEVLRSLAKLIERHRPDLLIEVLPVTEQALNEFGFVRDGSYRLFSVRPEGLVAEQRFTSTMWRNYVLLPADESGSRA
jgi:FkbM family methyltransferase